MDDLLFSRLAGHAESDLGVDLLAHRLQTGDVIIPENNNNNNHNNNNSNNNNTNNNNNNNNNNNSNATATQ